MRSPGDSRPSGRLLAGAGAAALVVGLTACSAPDPAPPGPTSGAPTSTGSSGGTMPTTDPPRWNPPADATWQWQLSGKLDLSLDVDVYDVDWQVPASVVADLHARGVKVICYVSVGTLEEYRDDAGSFPESVRGEPLEDWPDERWLDVRRLDLLGPPLLARLDVCRDKGFDAVEPDNVDAWANDSGFDLTGVDQLRFNRFIAAAAHERGLSVGLKNDLDQVEDLVGDFDFAVNEQCAQYQECDLLTPFVAAGKPVFHVEYEMDEAEFCRRGQVEGFSSLLKTYDLDAYRYVCP